MIARVDSLSSVASAAREILARTDLIVGIDYLDRLGATVYFEAIITHKGYAAP